MSEQTIQMVLILGFILVLVFLVGGASFIRLVGLILEHGSKVEALLRAVQQELTPSSKEVANKISSLQEDITRTTQALANGTQTADTPETKSPPYS